MPSSSSRSRKTKSDFEDLIGIARNEKGKRGKGRRRRSNIKTIKGGSKNFLKNLAFMAMISKGNKNKKQRDALIDTMDTAQMSAVRLIMDNFLNLKFPVKDKLLKKLVKEKNFLFHLAKPKAKFSVNQEILKQKGGFLSLLVPVATSLLAPALSGIFK